MAKFMLNSVAVITIIFCLSALISAQKVTEDCKICEDIVQTFHDKYRCSGEFTDFSNDLAVPTDCQGPRHSCSDPSQASQVEVCEQMQRDLREPENTAMMWNFVRREGDIYKACVLLKYCDADPVGQRTDCHRALEDPQAQPMKVCSPQCYQCNRLVADFPLFNEYCLPDGASIVDEVPAQEGAVMTIDTGGITLPTAGSAPPASFMETRLEDNDDEAVRLRRQRAAAEHGRAHQRKHSANAASASDAAQQWQQQQQRQEQEQEQQQQSVQKVVRRQHSRILPMPAMPSSSVITDSSDDDSGDNSDNSDNSESTSVFLEKDSTVSVASVDDGLENVMSAMEAESSANGLLNLNLSGNKPAAVDRPDTPLKPNPAKCYALWEELRNSKKARYFMSYKRVMSSNPETKDYQDGMLWDAFAVCKCLGKCPVVKGETIDLIGVCKYDPIHDLRMKITFPFLVNP